MMFSNQSKITRHDNKKDQVIKNKREKRGDNKKILVFALPEKDLIHKQRGRKTDEKMKMFTKEMKSIKNPKGKF